MKHLILFAILLLACSVVHGQQTGSKANAQQNNSNKPIANAPQPVKTVTVNEQQPEKPSQNANDNSNHAKSYFDMLSPENLPTTILAIVGVVGIIVAVCTLKTIGKQTKATEQSAKAMRESVVLQEVAYQPWVITNKWRVVKIRFDNTDQIGVADILFEIVNQTAFPIVLHRVIVKVIDDGSYSAPENYRLAPHGGSKSFTVTISLNDAKPASNWSEISFSPTISLINVWVEHEGILGQIVTDSFSWSCSLTTAKNVFIPLEVNLPKTNK